MKRRDFLSIATGMVAGRIAMSAAGGLGDQFFKGPLRVESAFDIFEPWTSQVVSEYGGWSSAVNRRLMKIPLESLESYLNSQDGVDFAFVNTAFWEKSHLIANLFSWVPFGHSLAQHQAWLASDGQKLMDQYFAQFGLKAITFGATGGISGFWTKGGVADLASLQGGTIFGRAILTKVFLGCGMKSVPEFSSASGLRITQQEGFKVATAVDAAKQALRSGNLTVLDWIGPYRDLQYGIPGQDVGYVTFEPDAKNRPSVFFLGVTSLKKWENLKSRETDVIALSQRVTGQSADIWSRYDSAATHVIKSLGSQIVNFAPQDVVRIKKVAKSLLISYATNDMEKKIVNSYLKTT